MHMSIYTTTTHSFVPSVRRSSSEKLEKLIRAANHDIIAVEIRKLVQKLNGVIMPVSFSIALLAVVSVKPLLPPEPQNANILSTAQLQTARSKMCHQTD